MRALCSTGTSNIFQFFDLKYILPKTLEYSGPQVSRQMKKASDKRKMLMAKTKLATAKENNLRQKRNSRGKKEIGHSKRKNLVAKEKFPPQKENARGEQQKSHGKRKKVAAKNKFPEKEKCLRQKKNFSW